MPRFRVGDTVILLGKYAKLYPSRSGTVVSVKQDALRSIFDEYTIEFSPNVLGEVFDFQLVEDVSAYRLLQATLAFDSFTQISKSNTRGAAHARQILLQASDLDIHLQVLEFAASISLLGQILEKRTTRFLPNVEIRLLEGDHPIDMETTNDVGEFRFSTVPKGTLTIEVLLRPTRQRVVGTISI